MTSHYTVATPGSRKRHALIAAGIDAAIDRVKQFNGRSGCHFERIALNVIGRSLVGPIGTELGQVDKCAVGGQHIGNISLQDCGAIDRDDLVLGIRIAQGDCSRVGANCGGRIGHSNYLACLLLTDVNTGCINREHTALVIECEVYSTVEELALDLNRCGSGLARIGIHLQLGGINLDRRSLGGRLDTHNHLLLNIKRVAAAGEGIQDEVAIAVTTPAPVHVIGIVAGGIAVHVKGMSTPAPIGVIITTINDGAALGKLVLEQSSPFVIGIIYCSVVTVVIGAGFELKASHLLIIAEELNSAQDVSAHGTATAGRIIHLLFLSDITHQPCHSIGLGGGVTTRVLVQHIVPVKCDRRQSRNLESIALIGITLDFRSGIGGILPVVEHHRQ